jgi:hypothetical protein
MTLAVDADSYFKVIAPNSWLGEADLPALQRGVVEGGDDDEPVAIPLGGLAELDVERLSGGGYLTRTRSSSDPATGSPSSPIPPGPSPGR